MSSNYVQYLPELSSMTGIIFYSFITYVFIFSTTYCCTELMSDKIDYSNFVDRRIKNNRVKKTKEADKLLKKF